MSSYHLAYFAYLKEYFGFSTLSFTDCICGINLWTLTTADTCAEEQEHFHAEIFVVGHLQPDQLIGDLQHLVTLVVHVG